MELFQSCKEGRKHVVAKLVVFLLFFFACLFCFLN